MRAQATEKSLLQSRLLYSGVAVIEKREEEKERYLTVVVGQTIGG